MQVFNPQETRINTNEKLVLEQVKQSLQRDLPELKSCHPHSNRMVVCAGSPSLAKNLNKVRKAKKRGDFIVCVNGTLKYLTDHGIKPDACVLCDANKLLTTQISVVPGVTYFVASCCHNDVFDMLKDMTIVLWHSYNNIGEEAIITGNRWLIHGGNTAALRCLNLGYVLGFRDFVYYGIDSSFEDNQHVYENAVNNPYHMEVTVEGKSFKTTYQLAVQARDFNNMFLKLSDCKIRAVGDGLIPHISTILNRRKHGHSDEPVRHIPPVLHEGRRGQKAVG